MPYKDPSMARANALKRYGRERDEQIAKSKARYWKDREAGVARNKEHYRVNKEYLKDRYFIRMYGESRASILARFSAGCNCCGKTETSAKRGWCVDHDHDTGVIRGVLCHGCNTGIGKLGDDLHGVQRSAVAYLQRYETRQQEDQMIARMFHPAVQCLVIHRTRGQILRHTVGIAEIESKETT